jgi:hypothetical protein
VSILAGALVSTAFSGAMMLAARCGVDVVDEAHELKGQSQICLKSS